MRLLIDGYNLMHAAGRMRRRFGPDGLRRARQRFLNELALRLGPEQAARTTIVFDAQSLPLSLAPETSHKGLSVIYAIEDDDADSRIEALIARHPTPRTLTVVSSDHRIRQAARRRRARDLSSDAFLDQLDTPPRPLPSQPSASPRDEERIRLEQPSPQEVEAWVLEFSDSDVRNEDTAEDTTESASGSVDVPDAWSDDALERIALEVETEFRDIQRLMPMTPDRRHPR